MWRDPRGMAFHTFSFLSFHWIFFVLVYGICSCNTWGVTLIIIEEKLLKEFRYNSYKLLWLQVKHCFLYSITVLGATQLNIFVDIVMLFLEKREWINISLTYFSTNFLFMSQQYFLSSVHFVQWFSNSSTHFKYQNSLNPS